MIFGHQLQTLVTDMQIDFKTEISWAIRFQNLSYNISVTKNSYMNSRPLLF